MLDLRTKRGDGLEQVTVREAMLWQTEVFGTVDTVSATDIFNHAGAWDEPSIQALYIQGFLGEHTKRQRQHSDDSTVIFSTALRDATRSGTSIEDVIETLAKGSLPLLTQADEVELYKQLEILTLESGLSASTDYLTGLQNKGQYESRILRELDKHYRYKERSLSIISMDLDKFKPIQDALGGHQYGDQMLREVAQIIRDEVRTTDYCFRIGGDEFYVVCPNTDKTGARKTAERIRNQIMELQWEHPDKATICLTASFGVATYKTDVADVEPEEPLSSKGATRRYLTKVAGALREVAEATLYAAKGKYKDGDNAIYATKGKDIDKNDNNVGNRVVYKGDPETADSLTLAA